MGARISQSTLYTNFINYLNKTTTTLQKLYEQGSSQKKINRPSDNPVGMARVLSYRDSIKALEQYKENINNSKGWLGLADTTLTNVEDQLTRLKELTVQASTGSLNETDRKDILNEVKEIYEQLLSLSNTTYEGRSIFAGHKTDQPAYVKGLAVYSNADETNPAFQYVKDIKGFTNEILVIEFSEKIDPTTGNSLTDLDGDGYAKIGIDNNIQYRVLKGDGSLITSGELNTGDTELNLGSVTIDLKEGYKIAVNRLKSIGINSSNFSITTEATGSPTTDIDVKIDEVTGTGFGVGDEVTYSYSLDGGKSWVKAPKVTATGSGNLALYLPDSTLVLKQGTSGQLSIDDRFHLSPIVQEKTQLIIAPTAIYQGDNDKGNGVEIINSPQVLGNYNLKISPEKNGSFDTPVIVRILSTESGGDIVMGDGNKVRYQFSLDDGLSWSDVLQVDNTSTSVSLELPGGEVTLSQIDTSTTAPQLTGLEFSVGKINVESTRENVRSFADGDIQNQIIVRIDDVVDSTGGTGTGFTAGDTIEYSYSLDGGKTWDEGHSITVDGSKYQSLPVPGGLLKIAPPYDSDPSNPPPPSIAQDDLFIIKPRDASMENEISESVTTSVNNVGTKIFGGFFKNSTGYEMAFANNEKNNLFVGVGKLIAGLELNNQQNISEALDYIDSALSQVTKVHAEIGAKINKLNASESILTDLQLNQTERKSNIEDVDFAELLTKISQQQTIYQAILKSASMIMKVSLVNYV